MLRSGRRKERDIIVGDSRARTLHSQKKTSSHTNVLHIAGTLYFSTYELRLDQMCALCLTRNIVFKAFSEGAGGSLGCSGVAFYTRIHHKNEKPRMKTGRIHRKVKSDAGFCLSQPGDPFIIYRQLVLTHHFIFTDSTATAELHRIHLNGQKKYQHDTTVLSFVNRAGLFISPLPPPPSPFFCR